MRTPLTCRILYAEDDEDSCAMMKVLLGFAGIEVIAAKTVAETWLLAQSERFDLYLLDSKFPDGDGLELCRRLRRHSLRIPILFYSGRAFQIDKKNGLDAGADEYLTKPDIDNLPERILSAVKLCRKYDEHSEHARAFGY